MNLFKSKDMKPADWIIDSVIQYICSPLFSDSVKEFIEEKCLGNHQLIHDNSYYVFTLMYCINLVFDGTEENKFSYTDLHDEFGRLVSSLSCKLIDFR